MPLRFWGLDATKPQSHAIGIDTSEKMQAKVREAADYPILKVSSARTGMWRSSARCAGDGS
jgi:hypothetical protein